MGLDPVRVLCFGITWFELIGGGVDSVNPEFRCWELLLEDF